MRANSTVESIPAYSGNAQTESCWRLALFALSFSDQMIPIQPVSFFSKCPCKGSELRSSNFIEKQHRVTITVEICLASECVRSEVR